MDETNTTIMVRLQQYPKETLVAAVVAYRQMMRNWRLVAAAALMGNLLQYAASLLH